MVEGFTTEAQRHREERREQCGEREKNERGEGEKAGTGKRQERERGEKKERKMARESERSLRTPHSMNRRIPVFHSMPGCRVPHAFCNISSRAARARSNIFLSSLLFLFPSLSFRLSISRFAPPVLISAFLLGASVPLW
jgi:hypothetical protein